MLLMLALPLQTFASAAMLGCTFSHQAIAEPMAMADSMMADCHQPEPSDAPSSQHNCKHCVACALASALPIPSSDTPAMLPVASHFIVQAAASFSGFIPDGPERPPRPFLA